MNNTTTFVDDLEEHVKKYQKIYEGGVLQPETHARLVVNMDSVAETARIPAKYIYTSAKDYCGPVDLEWAKRYKEVDKAGLVFIGDVKNVADRMMALTGAFVRNFKDARMYIVQDVVEDLKENEMTDCSVLAIPNFHVGSEKGKSLPAWQASLLLGLLLDRYRSNKPTLIYITSFESLKLDYGAAIHDHIEHNFMKISK